MQSLSLKTSGRTDFIDITSRIKEIVQKSEINSGLCLVFSPHTTAGITINEAADPDVKTDMIKEINKIIPLNDNYLHLEGNSAAHIKTTLTGTSVSIPVENRELILGTWQGIYFCEFDGPRSRRVTIQTVGI